jgi:hypothetical protein
MTDELKAWAEEKAYERAKSEYMEKLNGIRAEMERAKTEIMSTEFAGNSAYRFYNKGLQKALSIIDNHIQKGEDKA